jgi:hypothetical protein
METGKIFVKLNTVKGDLLSMDSNTLDYAMGSFIMEVRKGNGSEYRGNTLYEMI